MRPAGAFNLAQTFAAALAARFPSDAEKPAPRAKYVHKPGDRYTASRGRHYWVDNRGTVRRVRGEAANG